MKSGKRYQDISETSTGLCPRIGEFPFYAATRLEKNIGYVMVAIEHSAPGSKLIVDSPGGPRRATVVGMPFVDPDKLLLRAR